MSVFGNARSTCLPLSRVKVIANSSFGCFDMVLMST